MNQADANISKRSNVRWMIVVMLTLLALLGHFNRVSISVAGNERFIRDSLIDSQKMGMVYSVFLIVYTVVMLPAGWWIDRLGPKSMLTLMAIGMGVCVVLTGLLGYLSLDAFWFWILLMTIRGVAGMASTPLHPSAARAVSLWIPPSKRAWANGLVTAGALLGIAASYPLFGWLMDRVDWPAAFVICGLVMVAFGIVWQMLAADHATEHPWANSAERALVGSENLPRQLQGKEMLRECGGLLRNRSLLLLTLSYASVGYFQYLFFYWIEYFFEKRLGLPPLESRRASALVMLAMAAGMAFGGRLADAVCQRLGRRWGRRILAIGGMTLSALFAKIGLASDDPSSVTVWFALALGSLGACEGVFWTAITELGGRTGGLAAAFLNTGGNAGGSVAPWLTAVLVAKYGWDAAINVACGLAVFGGLLWLWLHPNHAGDLRT